MFRGWLLAAVTLGSVLLSEHAGAQDIGHHAGRNHGTSNNHRDPEANTQPSPLIAIENKIERIARAVEAANGKGQSAEEKDEARRNLAAQEKIANWAPAVFWVALAELVLTGIGLFLLWKTLTETRR